MKVVYIVPGFGGTFYCGNCLRDSAYPKSLKTLGHDAVTLPLYLPHSIEDFVEKGDVPVFYGAVNIYLKQNFKLFRKMPNWLYRFFNSPAILKFAAKKSGSTRAVGLEEMTISMLKGIEGNQKDELKQLIDYLKHVEKPDVIHLSNALLMGLAAEIKRELNIPMVCSLQDEDVWINGMSESYQPKLWDLMAEKGKDVDAFIAVSDFFAKVMQKHMRIPDDKIHTIHLGIDQALYKASSPIQDPPVIGYLSRMNMNNGFDILVDAFIQLKGQEAFKNAKLKLTGGKTGDDEKFINKQVKKLKLAGCIEDVEFVENFKTDTLSQFFESVSVLSVPVVGGEAFGLYQLEALACGVPIVQPEAGGFTEIIEKSQAGLTFKPNNAQALSEKLAEILSDKAQLEVYSKNGQVAIKEHFNTKVAASRTVELYQSLIK
jgi:glycosyltransferase involved in cell wall biosynthesis